MIIEELLTIDQKEFKAMRRVSAIRRTSREGNGLTIYCTTQRIQMIPLSFRAMCDVLVCGRIEEYRDIAALQQLIGPEPAKSLPYKKVGEWHIHRATGGICFDIPSPNSKKEKEL